MKTSNYSHKTQVDESIGQFQYDCSGFLNYALARLVSREGLFSPKKANLFVVLAASC